MPYELAGVGAVAVSGVLGVGYVLGYRAGYRRGARVEALRSRWEDQQRTARILAKVDQYGDLAGIQLGLEELEGEEHA